MIYLVYDPADNRIVKWISCTPETVRMQPKDPNHMIVWYDGMPPQLNEKPIYWDPQARRIIDERQAPTI